MNGKKRNKRNIIDPKIRKAARVSDWCCFLVEHSNCVYIILSAKLILRSILINFTCSIDDNFVCQQFISFYICCWHFL